MYSDPVKTCARISVINKFLLFKKKKQAMLNPRRIRLKRYMNNYKGLDKLVLLMFLTGFKTVTPEANKRKESCTTRN